MLEVIENTKIDKRYTIFPADYTVTPRSLEQTSREYQEHSVCLGRRAAADCLKQAGLKANEIDLLITVSCTGFMIPSLDAHLINDLGFRSDVRRLPITELGCAAGAAALGRAWDFLRGVETGNVLIVAVELPSADVSAARFLAGEFGIEHVIRGRCGGGNCYARRGAKCRKWSANSGVAEPSFPKHD